MSEQLGLDLKERGMALTLQAEREEWINAALFAIRHFAMRGEFRMEQFRAWYGQQPHSHHVWGALTNRACKDGLIVWTGQFAPSTSPKTHGHHVKTWRAA
jgi:hypothetical protein